jgi:uncharacterized membrane protein YeaQ/YmgE (transglycosylase-associated protein family)
MGIFGYLFLGLIAGAIAKLIMPGKQGKKWLPTLVIGVIGAIIGGLIGNALGVPFSTLLSLKTWALSVVGALIVLVVWGFIKKEA